MPLNTKALSNDALSNKFALLQNFSEFCKKTAVFLRAITSEETCSEYRNTLAAGAERDGFDHKIKFVRSFAEILEQGSSLHLLWNLNSVIKEAAELKTYLVKVSPANRAIKRRFFEKNIEAFRAFCASLSNFISLSEDSKNSLEYAIGGSALDEIQFQEDLMNVPDDPSLELIRQANNGDKDAIQQLRSFFSATEFSPRTAVLINGELSKSEDALIFIANTAPEKAFTEITQTVKIVKCTNRNDYLNLCNNTVKLALSNTDAELERLVIAAITEAKKTETIKLNQHLFANIELLKQSLADPISKIKNEIKEQAKKINRFLAAIEDLDNNGISSFFSHFKGELMLELFCLQYRFDEITKSKLLADFQSYRSNSVVTRVLNYFSGYQTQAADLAAKIETHYHAQRQHLETLKARAQKLAQLNQSLFTLGLQSQGSLNRLIVLLNHFTPKDRPLFRSKQSYEAFLRARDALVEKLRALPQAGQASDCSAVGQLYQEHLKSGFCLFGQYRKTRRALARQLQCPILPSKSSLKFGH